MQTIIDCYTDEPSGLGVPPYLGVYPRYLAGSLKNPFYLTIDDLRLYKSHPKKNAQKTNIKTYNLTKNFPNIEKILQKTKILFIILGVHTPGKYLSAVPATLKEIIPLIKDLKCKKILTGPAVYGTQLHGGRYTEKQNLQIFDEVREIYFENYKKLRDFAIKGASIVKQIPDIRIAEIETSHGCSRSPGCSFCLEPIKHKLEFRDQEDIYDEVKALYSYGIKHFRLGKQSCFYTYKNSKPEEIEKLLKPISLLKLSVLHIDNVNPVMVNEEITKLIIKYCTPGNVAAFGVESFDEKVIKANNLNSTPEITIKAIKILNKFGSKRGYNGMPLFLPGINLLLGLKNETKQTLEENYYWLKKILDENLLLRRINIRQVAIFPNTELAKTGLKYLKKNKKYYWKFREKIRKEIDLPMLKKLVPKNSILKEVRTEIHDGNTTFARQLGTYPLIVGIKQRLPLKKFINVKITDHMLRSVTGEVI